MNDSGLVIAQYSMNAHIRLLPQDMEAPDDAINARLLAIRDRDKRLLEIFGAPLYADTTILPRLNGQPPLGPAYHEGHEIKWGLWSPHRNALLDIFRRQVPEAAELNTRLAFAEQHGLKYAIVKPGWKVTADHLRRWLA